MSTPTIRPPTQEELSTTIPLVSKGWTTQREEFDFWFDQDSIEGTIPVDLRGTFFRNGPGFNDVYGVPLFHPIDGDGMICAITFTEQKAHFRSRFVETFTHAKEKEAQKMLFPGQMGSKVPGQTAKLVRFRDPSHTNVFFWGGKLLTCHEYSLPHALDPADLSTLGQDNLGKTLKLRSLSAHYRYDAKRDTLLVISFRAQATFRDKNGELHTRKNGLGIYEYDRNWNAKHIMHPFVEGLNYAHDFVVTDDWLIFHMSPFVNVDFAVTSKIASGQLSPGESMKYYPHLPSKMVFIERFPADSKKPRVVQLDTEPCHIYHFGTCVQTGNKDNAVIEFNACCLPPGFTMDWQHKAFLSNVSDAPGVMHEYVADLNGGTLVRKPCPTIADTSCEFPIANPYRNVAKRGDPKQMVARFFYMMSGAPGVALPFSDIVKYDTETKTHTRWHSDGVVGEPAFVPRLGRSSATIGDDDDGWLVAQVYVPESHRTKFVVLDAKHVEKGPVCTLHLKQHIPYGFHGTFYPEVFVHPQAKL